MRYCGFLSLPRAVLRYSYPPYAPLFLRKDLLNWSLAEFFSNITDCHSCHRRFPVFFPPPSYSLLKFTFLKNQSLAFMFCRKIAICFCLFYIPWARQMTHEIWAGFLKLNIFTLFFQTLGPLYLAYHCCGIPIYIGWCNPFDHKAIPASTLSDQQRFSPNIITTS